VVKAAKLGGAVHWRLASTGTGASGGRGGPLGGCAADLGGGVADDVLSPSVGMLRQARSGSATGQVGLWWPGTGVARKLSPGSGCRCWPWRGVKVGQGEQRGRQGGVFPVAARRWGLHGLDLGPAGQSLVCPCYHVRSATAYGGGGRSPPDGCSAAAPRFRPFLPSTPCRLHDGSRYMGASPRMPGWRPWKVVCTGVLTAGRRCGGDGSSLWSMWVARSGRWGFLVLAVTTPPRSCVGSSVQSVSVV
jgi:hypothetical protein